MPHTQQTTEKKIQTIGIAGLGAIGSAVGRALLKNIDGLNWIAASDLNYDPKTHPEFNVPNLSFEQLCDQCDIIIEALPPAVVPQLAKIALEKQKTLIVISSCALLMFPEILENLNSTHRFKKGRIIVPSGALAAIDGVKGLKELGIQKSVIASTKHPRGFVGAPYVDKMGIDLAQISVKTKIFEGNALEAAKGFPANVNVAATLSLAGIGAEKTRVEIWADPNAKGNTHAIMVQGEFSTLRCSIENTPDPNNPKSSMMAAQSIVALLKDMNSALIVL